MAVVELHRARDLSVALQGRWGELQDASGRHNPFLSAAWAVEVGRVRPAAEVAVIRPARGSDPSALWAFERTALGRARSIGAGLCDAEGLVADPSYELELPVLLRACGLRSWTVEHLVDASDAGPHVDLEAVGSPAMDLSGGFAGWEEACRQRSRRLLAEAARKERKLDREVGPVRLVCTDDPARLAPLIAWKSAQYRRTGRRDRFADPATRRLLASLVTRRSPRFAAPLWLLHAGERIVATSLVLSSEHVAAGWMQAYDRALARYSPGTVAMVAVTRAMAATGVPLFDLGKGEESYKSRFATAELPLWRGVAAASGAALRTEQLLRWPRERVEHVVLGNPRLRVAARQTLAALGAARVAIEGALR